MNCRAFLLLLAVVAPAVARAAPSGGAGTAPFHYAAEQLRTLQRRLNQEGFSSGHVDGAWGPITSKAVTEYQRKAGLQLTGRPDVATLQALGLLTAAQSSVPPAAPTPPPAGQAAAPPQATPAAPPPVTPPVIAAAPPVAASRAPQNSSGINAGTGRPEPTPGANSFTEGEARRRIEGRGFKDVGHLNKGGDGVWRGAATKDGQHISVWLDYQGDVGRQ